VPALTKDSISIAGDWGELKKIGIALSFMEDKGAANRMLNLASLNAARTFVPKLKQAAPGPGGGQGYATGRLQKSISARRAKYNWPGAVVGIKAGQARGDKAGAWYRWFYTTGTTPHQIKPYEGTKALKTKYGFRNSVQHPGWRGNNFVDRITDKNAANIEEALTAFHNTVQSSLNDGPFRNTILRYKRR
jgi:hypothetical protein